jgi:hypothetical protein
MQGRWRQAQVRDDDASLLWNNMLPTSCNAAHEVRASRASSLRLLMTSISDVHGTRVKVQAAACACDGEVLCACGARDLVVLCKWYRWYEWYTGFKSIIVGVLPPSPRQVALVRLSETPYPLYRAYRSSKRLPIALPPHLELLITNAAGIALHLRRQAACSQESASTSDGSTSLMWAPTR